MAIIIDFLHFQKTSGFKVFYNNDMKFNSPILCFLFRTQRFICSPCALLPVCMYLDLYIMFMYMCTRVHTCCAVIHVCYQASGEAIRGLLGLFGFSAVCHSLRARCKKYKLFEPA